MTFRSVARLDQVPDGGCLQVDAGGELVGLYRVGSDIYALGDVCTHQEAYLTEGEFDPDELEVECPLHGSRFNVATGAVRILPALKPEPTFEVKVEGDEVLLGPKREKGQ